MEVNEADEPTPIATELSHEPLESFPLKGFNALDHLGMTAQEFQHLSLNAQKAKIIIDLPSILQTLVSQTEAANIMMALSSLPETEIAATLHPPQFDTFLGQLQWRDELTPHAIEHRIRIRFEPTDSHAAWPSHASLASSWITAATTLLQSLGYTLSITRAPLECTEDNAVTVTNGVTASDGPLTVRPYSMKGGNQRGFDIWCTSTCQQFGEEQGSFPFDGPMVNDYFNEIARIGIRTRAMESYPATLIPCVALVNSDRRDRDDLIVSEFKSRIERLTPIHMLPYFTVIWCSINGSNDSNVMLKCIATTEDCHQEVTAMFQRLQQATVADTCVMTRTYTFHFHPCLYSGIDMDTIDAIVTDQRQYMEDCIKTVITGFGQQDPFLTIPPHPQMAGGSSSTNKSIAQLILDGTLLTPDGVEVFSPVMKVVTDSAHTRCYLISHKGEAGTLLTYTTLLAKKLPTWLGNTSVPIRTITTEVDRLILERAQVKQIANSLQQSHQDTQSQFEQRVQASLESLEAIVSTQNQRILALTKQLHSHGIDVTTVKSAVGSMQSSLTTPTVEWRDTIQEVGQQCVDRIIEHLDGHMNAMHKLNNDVEEAHINTSAILSDLVDRYDTATTDVYDSNVAYGNELAMLRLMVETCTDRINWLIEDWGYRSSKPETKTTKFRPEGVAHLHGEIYEHYYSGRDFREIAAEVREDNERARQETEATVQSRPTVGSEQKSDPVEGRPPPGANNITPSKGRPTTPRLHDAPIPPPTPPGPLRSPKAPPLPDSHSPDSTITPTDTASHLITRRDDDKREIGTSTRSPASSLHSITSAPPTRSCDILTPPFNTQESEIIAPQRSDSGGTCFCCNRKTFTPQECEICQMMFHTECIIFQPKRGLTLCRQCQTDQELSMDISSSDSTADLTTQASNTTDHDTAVNPTEVKLPDGTNLESSSSCDFSSSSSSGESSDVSSYSAPTSRPRRTASKLNPPSTSTPKTRTSSTSSNTMRKSIQTTLQPFQGKSTASIGTRTRSYTNSTIATDLKAKHK